MLFYDGLRLAYSIYFIGVAVFIINSLSRAIFKKGPLNIKLSFIGEAIPFCFIWPIALASAEGRKILFSNVNKL